MVHESSRTNKIHFAWTENYLSAVIVSHSFRFLHPPTQERFMRHRRGSQLSEDIAKSGKAPPQLKFQKSLTAHTQQLSLRQPWARRQSWPPWPQLARILAPTSEAYAWRQQSPYRPARSSRPRSVVILGHGLLPTYFSGACLEKHLPHPPGSRRIWAGFPELRPAPRHRLSPAW